MTSADSVVARGSFASAPARSWFQWLIWSDGFWAFLFLLPTFLGLTIVLGSVVGGC